jgi:hypothetical protein
MNTTTAGIAKEASIVEINAGTQASNDFAGDSRELAINPSELISSIYYTQLPTADQKAALAGSGIPSAANKFVTADTDALKIPTSYLDTDGTLAANSNTKIATQAATKTYADSNPGTHKVGVATRNLDDPTGSQTIAHGLGRTPKVVRLTAEMSTTVDLNSRSKGAYDGTTNACVYAFDSDTDHLHGSTTSYAIYIPNGAGNRYSYASATVDATNITLAWTNSNDPGATFNLSILWEVE